MEGAGADLKVKIEARRESGMREEDGEERMCVPVCVWVSGCDTIKYDMAIPKVDQIKSK